MHERSCPAKAHLKANIATSSAVRAVPEARMPRMTTLYFSGDLKSGLGLSLRPGLYALQYLGAKARDTLEPPFLDDLVRDYPPPGVAANAAAPLDADRREKRSVLFNGFHQKIITLLAATSPSKIVCGALFLDSGATGVLPVIR